jgi:hypothetical protein
MAFGGDDERRVKRRFDPNTPRDKQDPRHGSGRGGPAGASSSRATGSSSCVGGRGSRDYQIQ